MSNCWPKPKRKWESNQAKYRPTGFREYIFYHEAHEGLEVKNKKACINLRAASCSLW